MPIPSPHQYKYEFADRKQHDDLINKMAIHRGRHSGNITRQDFSNIFLHCLSRAASDNRSITLDSSSHPAPVIYTSACHLTDANPYPYLKLTSWKVGTSDIQDEGPFIHNGLCLNQLEQKVCQALDKLILLQTAKLPADRPYSIPHCTDSAATAQAPANGMTTLLDKIEGVARIVGDFIAYYEPLQLQRVEALPYSTKNLAEEPSNNRKTHDEITIKDIDSRRLNDSSEKKPELHKIVSVGREAMDSFFDVYKKKPPNLKELARKILKEKIAQRFHLNLDPDRVFFMQFDVSMYEGDRLLQYGPPIAKKTLTEYLFTNFGSDVQDYLVNVDAVSGIYDASQQNVRIHDVADAIKIKPTDFIKLIWDIDFYSYAKVKLTDDFSHQDEHIKNHFISFINHLDTAQIDSGAAKDVLNGVGLLKNNNVIVTPFDINQYRAADAFTFRNRDNQRVTLYFPKSDFKLISFRGDFEMRTWVTNACATEEHRKMLASHFTLANRQDGLFYYGVDAWLNSINLDNGYSDRIAISSVEVPSEHFFSALFNSVKAKTFSDLDSQIKSDAEVRRDMWEEMVDASNIVPNPVSPFLSLAMHIEHAINADTYREKMQEWRKIENDMVNLIALVVLDKMIKSLGFEGYAFINAVKEGINEERILDISNMLAGENKPQVPEYDIFNPQSPGWNWLFDNDEGVAHPAEENYPTVNESQYFDPASPEWEWLLKEKNDIPQKKPHLKKFLPTRNIFYTKKITSLNEFIYKSVFERLQRHPFDIFYGMEDNDLESPQYVNHARTNCRAALTSSGKHIELALDKLNSLDYEERIKNYLSIALDTTDDSILTEALSRLRCQAKRTADYLTECEETGFKNIGFVSTKQTVNPRSKILFTSEIKDLNYLKNLELGFSCKLDPYRRIFIMLDSSQSMRKAGTDILHRNVDLVDGIFMHEASHLSSDTMDFCYNSFFDRIFDAGNPKTLLEKFNGILTSDSLKENKDFELFMHMVYSQLGITEPYDIDVAIEMIKNDPMLKANMLMNNADNFVTFIKYLSDLDNNLRQTRSLKSDPNTDSYIMLIFTATRNHFILSP
ncbi:dermonecrotic toxin domain-containing protein [Erwinia tasmaniensis]|nr:DUF6543 domain-containing protein [Erwinia tasmaniensis]